ncbi:hypothetical protein JCM10213_008678 [Rhodosporidiobolus nylandii]
MLNRLPVELLEHILRLATPLDYTYELYKKRRATLRSFCLSELAKALWSIYCTENFLPAVLTCSTLPRLAALALRNICDADYYHSLRLPVLPPPLLRNLDVLACHSSNTFPAEWRELPPGVFLFSTSIGSSAPWDPSAIDLCLQPGDELDTSSAFRHQIERWLEIDDYLGRLADALDGAQVTLRILILPTDLHPSALRVAALEKAMCELLEICEAVGVEIAWHGRRSPTDSVIPPSLIETPEAGAGAGRGTATGRGVDGADGAASIGV